MLKNDALLIVTTYMYMYMVHVYNALTAFQHHL